MKTLLILFLLALTSCASQKPSLTRHERLEAQRKELQALGFHVEYK